MIEDLWKLSAEEIYGPESKDLGLDDRGLDVDYEASVPHIYDKHIQTRTEPWQGRKALGRVLADIVQTARRRARMSLRVQDLRAWTLNVNTDWRD